MAHRWLAELLQYQFIIGHRPERVMCECDMLSGYNKTTESWRDNDVKNASTEVSLALHLSMVKEIEHHQPVVLFTKESMGADKPVPVVNLPPVRFTGLPTRHGIIIRIEGSWDP